VLIKTISTKQLYNNELFIYRQDDREQIDKDFIITKTSRVRQSVEIERYEIYNQSERLKIFFRRKRI
jgi:hypothetical protein